jgi:hypothetical protein
VKALFQADPGAEEAAGEGGMQGKRPEKHPSRAEAPLIFLRVYARAKARTLHRDEFFRSVGSHISSYLLVCAKER